MMPFYYEGLPEFCYTTHETTGKTIIVKRGTMGYYPSKDQRSPEELNEKLGVTLAQQEAMSTGSLWGWGVPGANPGNWKEMNGGLIWHSTE